MTTTTARQENRAAPADRPGPPRTPSRFRLNTALLAGLLLLIGCALRLYRIDGQSIWWDEGFSWHAASLGLRDLIRFVTSTVTNDVHTPLYYLSLHFWVPVAGNSELALRYFSYVPSVLSLAIVYQLGRLIAGPAVGLAAIGFLAIAPAHVAYAQEARVYALVGCLAVGAAMLLHRAIDRGRHREWLFGGLCLGVGLEAHYGFGLVAIALGLWCLGRILTGPAEERRGRLGGALLAAGTGAILFLPWLPFGLRQVTGYASLIAEPVDWSATIGRLFRYLLGGPLFEGEPAGSFWLLPAGLALIASLALVVWLAARTAGRSRWALLLAPCLLLVPLAVYAPILARRPMFHPRYLLLLLPFAILIVATAAANRRQRGGPIRALIAVPIVGLSLMGLAGYYTDPAAQRDQNREMVRFMEDRAAQRGARPAALVDTTAYSIPYYVRDRFPVYLLENISDAQVVEAFRSAAAQSDDLFHVTWFKTAFDRRQVIPYLALRYGEPGEQREFFGGTVTEYRLLRPPDGQEIPDLAAADALFGRTLRLTGSASGAGGDGTLAAGGRIWAVLRWQLDQPTAADYRVGLRLTDVSGHEFGMADRTLVVGDQRYTSRWGPGEEGLSFFTLAIDAGAPPGDYRLTASVYDRRDPSRSLEHDRPDDPTHHLPIATIRLEPPAAPRADPRLPELKGAPADLGPLRWLGRGPVAEKLRAGDRFELPVYWQALSAIPAGAVAGVEAIGPGGAPLALGPPAPIGAPTFPADRWPAGVIQRDYLRARLPGDLPAGTYGLAVRVRAGADEWAAPIDARVRVEAVERNRTLPPLDSRVDRAFGPAIRLAGWSGTGSAEAGAALRPGAQLPLTLVWQALGETEIEYTVFVQVIGPEGRLVAQHDAPPAAGVWPTSTWLAGQVIEDRHTLSLPANLPPGRYRVIAGLYDPRTGNRLRPDGGREDYVELFSAEVP